MLIVILGLIAIAAAAGIWRLQQDLQRSWVSHFGEFLCFAVLTMSVLLLIETLCVQITGTALMQLTKEEQQVIEQTRTVKMIQQLKRELHELENRNTETMQQVR